jgi:hypothetical protein
MGRRRTRARHSRAPGSARQDHADELRCNPAFGGLPRGARRARQGVHGRDAGEVRQLHVPRKRPRRFHVPLRDEARSHAHRQRHVRRYRRRAASRRAAEGRQELRPRRERVAPELRRAEDACAVQHGQGARARPTG